MLRSFAAAEAPQRLHAEPRVHGVQEFYGGAARENEEAVAEAAPEAPAEVAEAPAAAPEAASESA